MIVGLLKILTFFVIGLSTFSIAFAGATDDWGQSLTLTQPRPWRAPQFKNIEDFPVAEGLKPNYQFWLDIYSKYTTNEGVIHDTENIHIVYEVFDFTKMAARSDMGPIRKELNRERIIERSKKKWKAVLLKLHKTKNPKLLNPVERKIWDAFASIKEKNKFLEAAKEDRMRFQLGQKDRIIQGIFLSGRYLEQFEEIFASAGVPIELTRLAFVESSYNVLARSKVGASGLWQIMPYTAKGIFIDDPAVDLRNHPYQATRLAARLLRSNYRMLQDWPLAITGYNHGPTGVKKISEKYNSRDIGELVDKKAFGFASRNFYASFRALLEVESNAPKYLGTVFWSKPFDTEEVRLPIAIKWSDLVRWFDGKKFEAEVLNPHINKIAQEDKRAIPKGIFVAVPKRKLEVVRAELESPALLQKSRLSIRD